VGTAISQSAGVSVCAGIAIFMIDEHTTGFGIAGVVRARLFVFAEQTGGPNAQAIVTAFIV